MPRRFVYTLFGLIVFFAVILLWASSSGPTVSFNTGPGGTGATLSDHKVGITATLDLSQPPQPYYGDDARDSQFYWRSNGVLAGLEAAQGLRPGLGWQDWRADGNRATMRLVGMGAEEGNAIDAGLVFTATDGQQYLFLAQPENRQISWYRWQGQPTDLLNTSSYRPTFALALSSLVGEIALLFFYALATLLLIFALAWLLKWLGSLFTRHVHLRLDVRADVRLLRFFPLLLFTLALLLTGYVAYAVLDAMPHVQDSAAYIFQARQFAQARLLVPDPGTGLHESLDHAYVLFYNGAWFSKYPPGYPLVLALGVLIGQPAIIDPLCGALALVFVYLAARRLFSSAVGVLAALLGLLSPFFITMSGAILSHSASMLGSVAFLYFFIVADSPSSYPLPQVERIASRPLPQVERGKLERLAPLLAGLSLGWLAITRELTALGIAAPFVIYAIANLTTHRNWPTLRRYLLMLAGALPPLLFLLLDNYVLTGSPLTFPHNLQNDFDFIGFGPGHGGDTQVGHTPQMGFVNTVTYLRELGKVLFGWPAPFTFVFIIFGAGFLILNFQPRKTVSPPSMQTLATQNSKLITHNSKLSLLLIAAPISLALAYYFWWAAARIFGPRYWYEMLPFLFILTAFGVISVGRSIGKQIGVPTAGMAASSLLLTLLIAYSLLQFTPSYIASFHDYNNMTPAERDTVAAANLHHAVIFTQLDPQTKRRDYSHVFWLNDPLLTHSADIIWLRDLGIEQDNATMQQYFSGWAGWTINRTQLSPIK